MEFFYPSATQGNVFTFYRSLSHKILSKPPALNNCVDWLTDFGFITYTCRVAVSRSAAGIYITDKNDDLVYSDDGKKPLSVGRRYIFVPESASKIPDEIKHLCPRKAIGFIGDMTTSNSIIRTSSFLVCVPYSKNLKQWKVIAFVDKENGMIETNKDRVISHFKKIARLVSSSDKKRVRKPSSLALKSYNPQKSKGKSSSQGIEDESTDKKVDSSETTPKPDKTTPPSSDSKVPEKSSAADSFFPCVNSNESASQTKRKTSTKVKHIEESNVIASSGDALELDSDFASEYLQGLVGKTTVKEEHDKEADILLSLDFDAVFHDMEDTNDDDVVIINDQEKGISGLVQTLNDEPLNPENESAQIETIENPMF